MPLSSDFRFAELVKADPYKEFRGKKWIVKHGDPNRPGYRLLHPGRPKGLSHRVESRGLSQKYKNARNVNMKPRPLSGQGKGRGRFKSFMVEPAARLGREADQFPVDVQEAIIRNRQNTGQRNVKTPAAVRPTGSIHEGNTLPPTGRSQRIVPGTGPETRERRRLLEARMEQERQIQAKPPSVVQAQRQKAAASIKPSRPVTVKPPAEVIHSGDEPRIVAVDIDQEFNDEEAFRAFFRMKDIEGEPMFRGDGRDRILVENDPDNNAQERFVRMAQRRNIQVVLDRPDNFGRSTGTGTLIRRRGERLLAMDEMLEAEKGRGFIVGFRNVGGTVGAQGDLIDLHLRRGADSRGNPAEAMIIQPGYRGRLDRDGVDVDSKAFGLAVEDVEAVGGPAPKASKSLDKIIFAPANMAPKYGGADKFRPERVPGAGIDGPYVLADTPVGRHFAHGGNAWDAPNEQLAEFMVSNPQRFSQKILKDDYRSQVYQMTDMKTGEKFILKRAEEGGAAKMSGDAAHEVLLAELGDALIPGRAMRTRYAADPSHKQTWLLFEHAATKFGTQKVTPAAPGAGGLGNHNEWLAFHLFDFLTNQSDRHFQNWLETRDRDGRRPIIIDNGGAGDAHYGIRGHETYERWLRIGHLQAPRAYIGSELREYYRNEGQGPREVERDFDGVMKVIQGINVDERIQKLIDQNNLEGRERAYMLAIGALWKKRQAQLAKDKNTVVKFLGGSR